MHLGIAVERPGIVAGHLALHPGTQTAHIAIEQWVEAVGKIAVAILDAGLATHVGKRPAYLSIPGMFLTLMPALMRIFGGKEKIARAKVSMATQAVGLDALAVARIERGIGVKHIDIGKAHSALVRLPFQQGHRQLRL